MSSIHSHKMAKTSKPNGEDIMKPESVIDYNENMGIDHRALNLFKLTVKIENVCVHCG